MSIEMQYLIDATMGNILSLYRLKKVQWNVLTENKVRW